MKPIKKVTSEEAEKAEAARLAIVQNIGIEIAKKRKEAIDGRAQSGIEQQWTEDEEFYQGYDDANRHEFVKITAKPGEGFKEPTKPTVSAGSTVFPNITAPYVDAAAARVGDMLMPTDDRNFALEESPIADLIEQAAQQGEQPQPQPGVDSLTAEVTRVKSIQIRAKERAKKAQTLIDDYLTECQFHAELRKCIDDASRIGSAVIKGPFPVQRTYKVLQKDKQTGEVVFIEKTEVRPASKRVDPWNAFPDPTCGENIHDGAYFFERDFITEKKLAELKGGQGAAAYLDDQIDAVIEEGPNKIKQSDARRFVPNNDHSKKGVFEVWYSYLTLTGEEMMAAGCNCEDPKAQYPVIATMINDRVIKVALNPIDDGDFPYDIMPWKRKAGMPWGDGVARQGRVAQRIVTAATRNLMDNAGASAKPHKVMSDDIEQAGDPWTWRVSSEAGADPARSMMFFVQPSLQAELMNIIQMGEKMMETQTGMPLILLGMQGGVQETAAGRQLQNNNGNSVLRRIARMFDSCITEPHIRRYDKWNKIYADDPEVKGDFQVKARGSAALVERDIQNQQMPMVMNLSLNPAFGWDPEKAGEEFLKSQRFTPDTFKLSDEKKKELASRPPPVAPQVAAAQIHESEMTKRKQMELQHDAQQNDLNRGIEKMKIEVQAQIDAAQLGSEERLFLENVKADLAGITLKLNTQRELSSMKGAQVIKPPTEPAGRAANGQAYQQ